MDNQVEHKLIKSHHIHPVIHGFNFVGKFNTKVAVFITNIVGTMWCAYVFTFIAFVSFPQAFTKLLSGDTQSFISWLSQSFLQLVLLSVLMVGTRVLTEASDQRAETDHAIITELQRINKRQLEILTYLKDGDD